VLDYRDSVQNHVRSIVVASWLIDEQRFQSVPSQSMFALLGECRFVGVCHHLPMFVVGDDQRRNQWPMANGMDVRIDQDSGFGVVQNRRGSNLTHPLRRLESLLLSNLRELD